MVQTPLAAAERPAQPRAERLLLWQFDAIGLDGIASRCHRRIGRRQLQQVGLRGSKRDRQVVREVTLDPEVARRGLHRAHAHSVRKPRRRDIRRFGERPFQGHRACVFSIVILRRPVADRHRTILDHRVGIEPRPQRREIDEQLEGAARLPLRLDRAVEGAGLIVNPADHREDTAVRAHGDQRPLRGGRILQPLGQDALRRFLHVIVERRPDPRFAIAFADHGLCSGRHPVGEIRAYRQILAPGSQLCRPRRAPLGVGDQTLLLHRRDNELAARTRAIVILRRGKARRRLHHPCQHRRLAKGNIRRVLREISLRRRAETPGTFAEINRRKVAFQDLLLRQPHLHPQRHDRFLRLAPKRAFRGQEGVLRQLLRDRRAALDHSAGFDVARRRPRDSAQAEAPMLIEVPVLDRDEGFGHMFGQFVECDRRVLILPSPGDGRAVRRLDDDGRLFERLQRLPQRRSPGQNREQQQQAKQRNGADPDPESPPQRWPHRLGGQGRIEMGILLTFVDERAVGDGQQASAAEGVA